MNKEVKELIEGIKKSIEVYEKLESPKDDLVLRINCYCTKLLLDYINQLEEKVSVLDLLENKFNKEEYEFLKNEMLEIRGGSNE